MIKQHPDILDYYDRAVSIMIAEKYGYTLMDALRQFVASKTHGMLEDAEYGMTMFGAPAIFDIWEAERVTGDPRASIYIRGE